MGGIVARYALKDMENRGEQHKTSLYISHDAPHQGAHIPLGILYFGRHMVDQFIKTPVGNLDIPVNSGTVGLTDLKELLDAPATKQLLINSVNSNFQVENNSAFMTELRTLGYPAQTRNIALSNASHCAQGQGVTAGSQVLGATANGRTTFLTDLVLAITPLGAISSTATSIVLDEPGFLLGLLPGRSKLNIDFRANAYPATGTAQVYYGRIRYTKNYLWLVPVSTDITLRQYNSASGTLPLDSYAGGVNPSFKGVSLSTFQSNALAKFGYTVNLNPEFNFIPVTSALDVGRGNVVLTSADYTAKFSAASPPTGSKATPFANFTTSFNTTGVNEKHITFNDRNGKWLASELDAVAGSDVFDCSFVCATAAIAGSSNICTTSTYSVPVPAGTTVNWSISPSSAATFTSGSSSSKTFTKSSTFNGSATITATISNNASNCGSIVLTKTVLVGATLNLTAPSGSTSNGTIQVSVSGGTGTYSWYKNGTLFATTGGGNNITLQFGCSGGLLRVVANTSCGQAEITRTLYGTCSSSTMAVYPNPMTNELFIGQYPQEQANSFDVSTNSMNSTQSELRSATALEALRIEFYNFSGILVKSVALEKSSTTPSIDVSDLRKGTYIVKIIGKELEEVHQIVKE